jgi:hypothetical protein
MKQGARESQCSAGSPGVTWWTAEAQAIHQGTEKEGVHWHKVEEADGE